MLPVRRFVATFYRFNFSTQDLLYWGKVKPHRPRQHKSYVSPFNCSDATVGTIQIRGDHVYLGKFCNNFLIYGQQVRLIPVVDANIAPCLWLWSKSFASLLSFDIRKSRNWFLVRVTWRCKSCSLKVDEQKMWVNGWGKQTVPRNSEVSHRKSHWVRWLFGKPSLESCHPSFRDTSLSFVKQEEKRSRLLFQLLHLYFQLLLGSLDRCKSVYLFLQFKVFITQALKLCFMFNGFSNLDRLILQRRNIEERCEKRTESNPYYCCFKEGVRIRYFGENFIHMQEGIVRRFWTFSYIVNFCLVSCIGPSESQKQLRWRSLKDAWTFEEGLESIQLLVVRELLEFCSNNKHAYWVGFTSLNLWSCLLGLFFREGSPSGYRLIRCLAHPVSSGVQSSWYL